MVRSLTQKALPGPFREATVQYLVAGREGKAEGLAETLMRQLKRRFPLDARELEQVREVTDTAKLQAALDEIIEPGGHARLGAGEAWIGLRWPQLDDLRYTRFFVHAIRSPGTR